MKRKEKEKAYRLLKDKMKKENGGEDKKEEKELNFLPKKRRINEGLEDKTIDLTHTFLDFHAKEIEKVSTTYTNFCLERCSPNESCYQFWQRMKSDGKYQKMYSYVFDHLFIPASSISCERVFSILKFIFDPKRQKMDPDRVSKLCFIKNHLINNPI